MIWAMGDPSVAVWHSDHLSRSFSKTHFLSSFHTIVYLILLFVKTIECLIPPAGLLREHRSWWQHLRFIFGTTRCGSLHNRCGEVVTNL